MDPIEIMKRPAPYASGHENAPAAAQLRAKRLCWEYNRTAPDEAERRGEILRELLGTCDPLTFIEPDFRCDYGFNIHTHGLTIVNYNCVMLDTSPIDIGAGAFIAEIQQTSDITYRIYDFNRKDADGNTRELHTELAKGAIDYTVLPDYRTKYEQVQDRETELVSCPYFTTSLCDLTAPLTLDYAALDSFVVVICVEGKGMIADDSGNEMPIHQGETVLLPATVKSLRVVPEGKLKMLTSCIK